jgi:hypothetical protein
MIFSIEVALLSEAAGPVREPQRWACQRDGHHVRRFAAQTSVDITSLRLPIGVALVHTIAG